jgi:hypothetical protein
MLVQLGLNKEQLDTNEKEIAALHDALFVPAKRRTADKPIVSGRQRNVYADWTNRCLSEGVRRMKRECMETSKLTDSAQEVEKLTVENADLKQQVEDLSSAIAYTDGRGAHTES